MLKKVINEYPENILGREIYSENLLTEYRQCIDEGLHISAFKDVFESVSKLHMSEYKAKLADTLFDAVLNSSVRSDYEFYEPSDLDGILESRKVTVSDLPKPDKSTLRQKIEGAWYGRICGCLLGKPVEGMRIHELVPFLKESGNFPMTRYILSSDATEERIEKYEFNLRNKCYADTIDCAPSDDDTNYTALYQKIIDEKGKGFTSSDVARAWLREQSKEAYFTAERVAFQNFINGYAPPESAIYKNPYREWIGAQIRADYFGYIYPGNPEKAAESAWRDARISHTKNGIYGEMFVAAMIAAAAVCDDIYKIINAGLSQIPEKSRLHKAVENIIQNHESGLSFDECVKDIYSRWDDRNGYDWCHTISNAQIVVAALLYGENDYGKSVCLAVQTGFDTDCNGATVGSVLGMKNGISSIGDEWISPVKGKLQTQIFSVGTAEISKLVDKTLEHIEL